MLFESITALDLSILDFIHNTLSNSVMDFIMVCITYSIEYGAMAILVFIVMMCIKKMRKTGFAVMGATLSVLLFGELILKHIVCRPRPFVINGANRAYNQSAVRIFVPVKPYRNVLCNGNGDISVS